MPKSGDKDTYTSEELQGVRRQQMRAHFVLYLVGWLVWPIGGQYLVALVTFHRKGGWYYAGNVGDAYTYAVSGPFSTKSKAWQEGKSRSWGISYNHPQVFFLFQAPDRYHDVRKAQQSHSPQWPLFA